MLIELYIKMNNNKRLDQARIDIIIIIINNNTYYILYTYLIPVYKTIPWH